MRHAGEVKVWDIIIRFFHWTLVAAFSIAYLTEDDLMTVHAWAGYTIVGLLALRLLWGLVGTRYARFSSFLYSPGTAIHYLKDVLTFRAKRYVGHNPAGGLMILAMLFSLALTTLTGMAVYGGGEEQAGPLAGIAFFQRFDDAFEEAHEFFANFTLFLVVTHLAGVIVESILHRENLVSSMVTGFKRSES